MLTNKEIANLFHELASLMELHDENPFKLRSYENAYLALRKMDIPLMEMEPQEWKQLKGIGTAIAEKLAEIKNSGTFQTMEHFREKTPPGVQTMLRIKGLGPKKVKSIWKELNIESPGELAYACGENRLIELKGFGAKIQEDILKSIAFFDSNQKYFLFSTLEREALHYVSLLRNLNPNARIEFTGALRRALPVLEGIDLLVDQMDILQPEEYQQRDGEGIWNKSYPVHIYVCEPDNWNFEMLLRTSGSESFQTQILTKLQYQHGTDEMDIFVKNGLPFIPAECRDLDDFSHFNVNQLLNQDDICGVVHAHSTYSDGLYSLEDMANECMRLGYQYLVISDHSRSAFYANGLSIERVEQQWRAIDDWNNKNDQFKIFKSIESDILNDGSLDYPDDMLQGFDVVIASVHSNLKMDETKAMHRLLRAIENPYTRILGHPTGRLLLSRPGYPVNHHKIIDACAAHQVAIELNANPLRLDLDWNWIQYAMEKGVLISVNPDAHNLKGIQDIRYGVLAARKGGLLKNYCLNSKNISEFKTWISSKSNF